LTLVNDWSFLQTRVALKRIAVYLDEEVTEQFSSLKKDHSEPYVSGVDEGLELEGATLKWNEVVEVVEKGSELDRNKSSSPTSSEVPDESSTVVTMFRKKCRRTWGSCI